MSPSHDKPFMSRNPLAYTLRCPDCGRTKTGYRVPTSGAFYNAETGEFEDQPEPIESEVPEAPVLTKSICDGCGSEMARDAVTDAVTDELRRLKDDGFGVRFRVRPEKWIVEVGPSGDRDATLFLVEGTTQLAALKSVRPYMDQVPLPEPPKVPDEFAERGITMQWGVPQDTTRPYTLVLWQDDRLLNSGAFYGTPEECVGKARQLLELGEHD
jgi:hypothetical protein